MSDLTYGRVAKMLLSFLPENPPDDPGIKVWTFPVINVYRAYRRHADRLNVSRPHRKISWRRLNNTQKQMAILNEVLRVCG